MELDSVDKWQTVIEYSSDIITILDEDHVIKYESPSTERILGFEAGQRVGDDAFEYIHPEDREAVKEIFEQTIQAPGDVTERIEFRYKHADGSWIWLESIGSNKTNTGLDGYVINSRDITERKRFEEELTDLVDEHETLNRIVRHDIRNDLSVILGWAHLLDDNVDEEGEEYLTYILESIEQMVELTEVVRDYVKTLSNDEALEVEPVLLRPILKREILMRAEAYPSATVTQETTIPSVEVIGNELLSAVFRNLINNAIKHNDSEEPVVEVSVEELDETVRIAFADNGPGIPDDRKETIFGKGEAGLDDPDAGIGLYLVQTLVNNYGGEVWIEDNDPVGSVFFVELPIAS